MPLVIHRASGGAVNELFAALERDGLPLEIFKSTNGSLFHGIK